MGTNFDPRTEYAEVVKYIKDIFQDDVKIYYYDYDRNFDSSSNVVIVTTDHWGDDEYLLTPLNLRPNTPIERIENISRDHSDKNFYILTVCPFLEELLGHLSNVKVIHWGDDFLLHPDTKYHQLLPINSKEFSSPWHWTCLNNNLRMHRNICTMFLLGEGIKNGCIRFDPSQIIKHESWRSFLTYLKINKYKYLNEVSNKIYPVLEKGFIRTKLFDGYEVKKYLHRDNPDSEVQIDLGKNFDQYLRPIYAHTVLDIITETVLINRTGIITEKYLNSIYGYNFPIYIGMRGSISYLKSLGFDLFDDVIDHNYDNIENHYLRMITAIRSNRRILEDRNFALDCWHQCQQRFHNNWTLIEKMYTNKEILAKQRIQRKIEKSIL